MDKTPFSDKCRLLAALWFFYRDNDKNDNWQAFFDYADVGLPLAYVLNEGIAVANDESEKMITDTWEVLCQMLNIDPTAEYNTITDMFGAAEDE